MRLKIQTKFILITIVVVLTACSVGTLIAFHHFVHSYEKTVGERIFAQADGLKVLIEDVTELGLNIGELRGLSQECKKMVVSIPYGRYCFITDKAGKVFYHNDLQQRLKTYTDSVTQNVLNSSKPFSQRYFLKGTGVVYDYSVPLFGSNSDIAGYLRIGVDSRIIYDEVLRLRNFYIVLALVVAAVASFLVYWFFSFGILGPIQKLTEGVSLIGKGNLDYQIDLGTHDEIGDLASAFNVMASNLKKITASRDDLNNEIDRRKKIEEDLRQEKNRAQQYLDVAGIMMMALDTKGDVILINERGCEILGYSKDEIIGKNWFSRFLPHKSVNQVREVHGRLMTGETELLRYHENPIVTKKQEERVILWNNCLLKDKEGKVVGVLSSGEDVTERRRSEKVMTIQKDLGIALSSTHDLKEAVAHLLDAALKIEGFDSGGVYIVDEQKQALVLVAHRGLDLEFVKTSVQYDFQSPQAKLVFEGRPLYKSHTEISLEINLARQREGLRAMAVVPIHDRGKVVAVLNLASHMHQDTPLRTRHAVEVITSSFGGVIERIKVEEDLRTSEEKYRELVQNANSIILRMSKEGNVTFFNEYAQHFFGFSEKEILGKNVVGTIVPLKEDGGRNLKEIIEAICMEPEEHSLNENQNIRRDEKRVWIAWTNRRIINKQGQEEILCIGTDISRRKEAEQQLEKMYLDLQAINKELRGTQDQLLQSEKMVAVGQFSAGVAHEVKNPLAIILLGANVLLKKVSGLDKQEKEHLGMIRNAAERANRVITDLLSLSRDTEVRLGHVSIQEILDDSVSFAKTAFSTQKIVFKKEYPSQTVEVMADKILMEQVFFNLFANAADAIKRRGTITIRANKKIDEKTFQEKLIIEVEDNGEGMPPDVASRIFEPFFTTKEEGKGTGLGLSISYMVLQRHSADIKVESEVGKGTKFTVTFPIKS
ncbi:MAG: PAS domain S-box protein [Candidatus Aceula meridiana]|nr:PAS domain S-box protein [Candidatus Aceula meridiana]